MGEKQGNLNCRFININQQCREGREGGGRIDHKRGEKGAGEE